MIIRRKQKTKLTGSIFIACFLFILTARPVIAVELDSDHDGLADQQEVLFKTNPNNPDTDNDGYLDGVEVRNGYDPLNKDKKLAKKIEINTKKQELSYFLGEVNLGAFPVSTGKPRMVTPRGEFKVDAKSPRAWSRPYKLWMPYWMSLNNGKFGIHELPEWPGGKKEGVNHLGKPVSHGCIRLGVGPAKTLYEWSDIGTIVKIY